MSESSPASRASRINDLLATEYPDAECELDFRNPLELLVATVLSAQCTDARVNQVTPELFEEYPSAAHYAAARRADLEAVLRPLGFQRAKAGHLLGIGEKIMADFDGQVPTGIKELTSLPGVGRKTALVVRGNAFGLPGITVDTHFGRLMQRMALSESKTPLQIEKDIAQLLPEEEWTMFSHRIIFHGRRVCHARSPQCGACVVRHLCPTGAAPPDVR
ncbi:endonuclease III [Corynebacterium sp. HMSC06D04]|uniref:Endonuclease III n=2 Tax=Corynebacterium TaxID=1716 RepID=A0A2A4AHE1_9CORY|nr:MULTISPECIES: endonuclease III [Corynebacterium]PCC81730.1 endonuclease III [Corynebacterium accolens]KXU19160.1 endonuclease III [Corynebacterium simulans]OFQ49761.1 endonuclease III [Corynebacterium sp. HMSC076D02]OFR39709.1 endonuclease III [Corynebacterium sp. HMSC077D03]OFT33422.1 endonuclease III [Corynebacterium sp. HMSC08C04]